MVVETSSQQNNAGSGIKKKKSEQKQLNKNTDEQFT